MYIGASVERQTHFTERAQNNSDGDIDIVRPKMKRPGRSTVCPNTKRPGGSTASPENNSDSDSDIVRPKMKRPVGFTARPENTTDSNTDVGKMKLKKRRWSESELSVLFASVGHFITNKKMPPGKTIHELAKKLANRTPAQVRAQINNFVKGKVLPR